MRPRYKTAKTQLVDVNGARLAYRRLGTDDGVPVVFLHHLTAVLDDWDPRVVDGLAATRPVITFDNRGVGGSSGSTPKTVGPMASDAIAFIKALGLEQVDLFGFSLGGFVAQVIAEREPALVRKIVLAGTGPAGGEGIDRVTAASLPYAIRALSRGKDPRHYLFFPRTTAGQAAARDYLGRLSERSEDRDTPVSLRTLRAQLKAIRAWGKQQPSDLSRITQPVFVANGDHDVMVPTSNTFDLLARLPHAQGRVYTNAGHGGVFHYHEQFVREVEEFLDFASVARAANT
jgi:pimeloyl-ACP methyl ester carboxylesterase